MKIALEIKVADEVFLAVAELHRINPNGTDFSVSEILEHGLKMGLTKGQRPGFAIHVRQHCVANLPPNPGRYRMLFATGKARRRLLLPGDPIDSKRDGKIFPDPDDVPPRYHELIEWAKQRYESARETKSVYEKLIELRGTGKGLWPEGADQFIRELRKDWE